MISAHARQIAEEVLFAAALATDRAARISEASFRALADAGLFGTAGPIDGGGLDLGPAAFAELVEVLASGCLATTFVWIQHHGAVQALRESENESLRREWLGELCAGRRRSGVAFGGVRPGPQQLHARFINGGWLLEGVAPWVTGWGLVDGVLTWALSPRGERVSLLIDATPSDTLASTPLELIATNASRTVELTFHSHFVPSARLVSLMPHTPAPAHDGGGRSNGSLALGVARRCCALLGPSALDAELDARRAELDAADDFALARARAAAVELSWRASATLITTQGSRSISVTEHAQRLAREALFLLVFGTRPAIRAALLEQLAEGGGSAARDETR